MQTSQAQSLTAARAGMLHQPSAANVIGEKFVNAAVSGGQFVTRNAADDKAKLPTSAAMVQTTGLGFVVLDTSWAPVDGATTDYDASTSIPVMSRGYLYAYGEEAMALGDAVYVRITSDGGTNTVLGRVRNDADTGRCVQVFNARVEEASSGAGPVLIYVDLVPRDAALVTSLAGETGEYTVQTLAAYTSNDTAPASIVSGGVYDVPATGANSTITLPAAPADGTHAIFVADGTKNSNTVQYRDATGPVNITTALTASKRHMVHVTALNGIWNAIAYVSP
jgi:hypothetical protein